MAIGVKILASASLPCHPNSLWQAFAKVKRNYPLYALKIMKKIPVIGVKERGIWRLYARVALSNELLLQSIFVV